MSLFNIVDPARSDFAERVVSPESEPEKRANLVAFVRKLIDERGEIKEPIPTKTHTSEELAAMGYVGVYIRRYPNSML